MQKNLPSAITSYDLIKAFAVIIMIADHLGYYFFPEQEWWRAIGRVGFPIWFFLVGFSRGRSVSRELIIGAGILAVASLILQSLVIPFSALVTIIIIRLMIDPVMKLFMKGPEFAGSILIFLAVFAVPSWEVCEYGFLALITAMFGNIVRNQEEYFPHSGSRRVAVLGMMLYTLGTFIFYEQLAFSFSLNAFLFMAIITSAVLLVLSEFRSVSYPGLSAQIPASGQMAIQFLGRRTLEIYVGHLVLFKIAGVFMHPDQLIFMPG